MKHPALARVFSVVLAIVALIQLAVGVRGLRKTDQEHAERVTYAERFEDRIENFQTLKAELAARPDYDKTMTALKSFTKAHERAASRHKTDTAIYTATKGGLKMGEELIIAGREELAETRDQLHDPETRQILMEQFLGQMLASQNIAPELNRVAGMAQNYVGQANAAAAGAAAEAQRYETLLAMEPQPPEEPAMPPEPQPPEEPLPPEKPTVEPPEAPTPPTPPELVIPDLPDADEAEREAAAQEAQAQYELELAAYEAACAEYETALQIYEEELARFEAAAGDDTEYEAAYAAWEEEHAAWEIAYAAWEEEHAAWEIDCAAWQEEHAAWEQAYADWEVQHAAWEETCRKTKEESSLAAAREAQLAFSDALMDVTRQANELLNTYSAETGETYPELQEMLDLAAETAARLRELGIQDPAQLSDEEYLALCRALEELAGTLADGFAYVAGSLENPVHTILEIMDTLQLTDTLVDYVDYQLDKAEKQLQGALEQLWYQAGELQKDKIKLEAQKRGLDSEAKVLVERTDQADSLKDLRSRYSAARLSLINVPEVKSGVTDDESIPAAAEAYLRAYEARTDALFEGRRLINALAIAGGVLGAAGIPAAYELLKKRFWLVTPVLLCLVCSAGAEALNLRLGLGQLYVALCTAVLALIQLLIVLPRKKRPRHLLEKT